MLNSILPAFYQENHLMYLCSSHVSMPSLGPRELNRTCNF